MGLRGNTDSPEQITDQDLEPGDILIFKIPTYKPSLSERFIRFMQRARHDSRDNADAVHAAVVTDNTFGAITIAHYINGGYQQEMLLNMGYDTFPYEVFRPNSDAHKSAIIKEAEAPSEKERTHYSPVWPFKPPAKADLTGSPTSPA